MQVSETIENIVDIYNGNEEIHLIEEEENRNMFADVVRRFGELFDCPTKTFTHSGPLHIWVHTLSADHTGSFVSNCEQILIWWVRI